MKEAQIFENWANGIMEGTWALPDNPQAQAKLDELMSKELIVGPDATNATEQLYDLLGDDELFDQLQELADRDANADARQVIYDRMQQLNQNSDVLKVINSLNIDADLELDTPESVSAFITDPPVLAKRLPFRLRSLTGLRIFNRSMRSRSSWPCRCVAMVT